MAVVAVSMALWGRQQQAQKSEEIQQFVRQVCRDLGAGRDRKGFINPEDSFAEQRTIEALRAVCVEASTAARVQVRIVDARTAPMNVAGDDTYAAIVRLDDFDRLGLVVQHAGDPANMRITGYWDPAASAPAP